MLPAAATVSHSPQVGDEKRLPIAGPEGLGRAGSVVVNSSVAQCQREETPWVAQSPAGVSHTLPCQTIKKGL